MDGYRKQPMFKDNLDEFDESRETVVKLIEEYKSAETPNYIDWGKPLRDDDMTY